MFTAGPETIMGSNTAGGQAFVAAGGIVGCRAGAPDWIAVPIAQKRANRSIRQRGQAIMPFSGHV